MFDLAAPCDQGYYSKLIAKVNSQRSLPAYIAIDMRLIARCITASADFFTIAFCHITALVLVGTPLCIFDDVNISAVLNNNVGATPQWELLLSGNYISVKTIP